MCRLSNYGVAFCIGEVESSGQSTPAVHIDIEDDEWVRNEIARLEIEREKAHLRARLLALQAERAKGFPVEAPDVRAEKGNAPSREPMRAESISLSSASWIPSHTWVRINKTWTGTYKSAGM